MKNLLFRFSFLLIVSISLLTSCEEDGTIRPTDPEPEGPSISLISGGDQVTSAATLAAGNTFTVQVSAQAGDNPLEVFTVKRNGTNVPFSSLNFDQSAIAANPVLIASDDFKLSINWTIQVTTDPAGTGVDTYSFEIKDESDRTSTASVSITLESLPPSSSFVEDAPYFWTDKTCPIGSTFQVRILADKGTANLATFAAFEDGILIDDLSRIKINEFDLLSNPTSIADDSQEKLDFTVTIQTSEEFFGTFTYDFVITDANGQETSQTIDVTLGTPTTELTGRLLLNSAGPTGTGGINLSTGEGVGSTSMTAHLKDEGINTDLAPKDNWRQQISGANEAEIRLVGDDVFEGFSFDGIFINEQIENLFDTGKALVLTDANGTPVTDKIVGGEILFVKSGNTYFAVRIDAVNVSDDDNNDFYELSIKN